MSARTETGNGSTAGFFLAGAELIVVNMPIDFSVYTKLFTCHKGGSLTPILDRA